MGKAFLFLACLVLATQAVDNDPEIEMNAPEIIQRWGYPVEIHTVETTDGYLIDIHRIPAGKNQVQTPNKPVVFMQHGFMCDSSNWIVNLPDQSAGFIFADAGYDVWLGNVRGNTYGKKHKTLNPKSEKFWEFSKDFCGTNPTNDYCDNILFLISGPESTQFNDLK
ncbi:unnamed protein product, partial [Mesorhabditis belari]|uniref:Partial AB-hydrolase lipase domain-containing protein n=1 Tax=Mesorhabditis belari TaxID=2138241 RepID=A0AAF3F7Q1_9BILA